MSSTVLGTEVGVTPRAIVAVEQWTWTWPVSKSQKLEVAVTGVWPVLSFTDLSTSDLTSAMFLFASEKLGGKKLSMNLCPLAFSCMCMYMYVHRLIHTLCRAIDVGR